VKKPLGDGEDIGATITTTTMSTTTFRDGAFHARSKSTHRASRDAGIAEVVEQMKAEEEATLERARAVQAALMTANASESLANPAVALALDQIRTPLADPAVAPKNPLESVSTPPTSPLPAAAATVNVATHKVTVGFEAQLVAPAAEAATEAEQPLEGGADGSVNLSINTDLNNVTPPMARFKSESHLAASWQEGPEYERTAGASPRDPVMSPGGRLLPKKKDNWHFPVSFFFHVLLFLSLLKNE